MARIRTLDFLPEIFQTPTNAEFLAATLDQLVTSPSTLRIQGYVGSKLGYGINATNNYVTEPTKVRTDYQLDPAVVFTKKDESLAKDFITYPGMVDALNLQGSATDNNSRLFESQFYSWDSFTDLDKLINYNQYYWLPDGAPSVTVATAVVFSSQDYIVTALDNLYNIAELGSAGGSINPTLTLLRGGQYTFTVDQETQFWIQGEPGVTGYSPTQPNLYTRDVYGVSNNGATKGIVTFTVPSKDAQDEYLFPDSTTVDVISTLSFDQLNGAKLSSLPTGIDGITGLNGLTVMFYNTGVPEEVGYTGTFFAETDYDINSDIFVEPVNITVASCTDREITLASGTTDVFLVPDPVTGVLMFGQPSITFSGPTIGGLIPGQVYYVKSIVNSTKFVISQELDVYEPIAAETLVPGVQYVITSVGDTDFTLIGAASNTVGTIFTATGPGLGTGTASKDSTVLLTPSTGLTSAVVNQGLYQEGFYTTVDQNFYRIEYLGDPNDPILRLMPAGLIPINTNIVPVYGTQFIGLPFYKSVTGLINMVPYLSASKDVLYYQDSRSPNMVGTIRLIEGNINNTLDVETDIIGKKNFTSTNGVVFTNGLKVSFDGDIVPASYLQGEYYVEGVGTSIELIPVESFICPENFTRASYNPYDIAPYDIGNYDTNLFVPLDKDYITIARNSINKNAWSRSNRWFHVDVINATAQYNNNPKIVTQFASQENKANRPIIEFYPNLKLFQSGIAGKDAIDFFDIRQTDALSVIPGTRAYYPDVETYTAYTATINPTPAVSTLANALVPGNFYTIEELGTTDWNVVAGTEDLGYAVGQKIQCVAAGSGTGKAFTLATETTIEVPENDITGLFQIGMYIGDTQAVLPTNAQLTNITGAGTGTLTLTVVWPTANNTTGAVNASIVGTDTTVNNYNVFPGARIIFSNDLDGLIKHQIYVVDFNVLTAGSEPVITLSLAEDAIVLPEEQVAVLRGYNYQGKTFYYTGLEWKEAQQKSLVNQPPLFDVLDENGISFGDTDVYNSSSFQGNKLFAYGISDSTIDDPILGFPVRYSTIDNVGDVSFDISLNLDTFDYIRNGNPITQQVNTGYVYDYSSRVNYTRLLGWQTAVAPSTQYQVFSFPYNVFSQPAQVVCDVAMLPELAEGEKGWPRIQVFFNNVYQEPENYSVVVGDKTTTVTLNAIPQDPADSVVQVLILSNQVSQTAYYTIPVNLSNNPFNEDLTQANLGDIRMQYRDIFINAPGTTGEVFGSNNYRDLGNLVPYGTKIIQNSASLAAPGAFLRKKEHDLFNALLFNSREYVKFKQLIVDTVQTSDYEQRFTPSEILDAALDQITGAKSQLNAFFWSDMLPSKSPYRSNTYTFANSLDTSIYPLSQIYNFGSANYNGVLVYLTRTIEGIVAQRQLLRGKDYVISTDSPSLTVTLDLLPGDKITVKEYNQTYGSYVPNTPTKLGLWQAYEPEVILDSNYSNPTYFIRGHDGSYTKLYGQYLPEANILIDFRDQALLEFEKRIYNNLKLSTEVPIYDYEVVPGFFRDSTYSWDEFLRMYSPGFLNWIGQNRIDYKTQFFNKNNQWTYNYTNSQNKLDKTPIPQGYWRGVYDYLYDTTTPESTPWEMLGFSIQPSWWEARYGPAPYTSDNGILWGDLELGYVWNNGDSYIIPELARPGLSKIIPVDSNGQLSTPLISVVGNYNPSTFQKDWKVGDMGPAELSYRRSSSWPFDAIRLFALTRPAEFFNLAIDLDNYKYNEEFNQYLVNNRKHLVLSDVEIYGNGTAKTSYINWIVDYEKQVGIPATENITTLLDNLDVRLAYRLAGFSDKTYLKFYVEKGSPNSNNASLLIPDESYQVLLYDNQPYDQLMFSGVVIQKTNNGWSVFGNSQTFAYFTVLDPLYTGNNQTIEVPGASVRVTTDYSATESFVPYGTVFYSYQEVATFIMSYAAWLQSKGMIFDQIVEGREINWILMVQEFLYWLQIGWEVGSVITLNPAANMIKINKESTVVQPLTLQQQNFILNQDLYPIQLNNLNVYREETEFKVEPLNTGDSLAYGQFSLSNFEHGIVFNNVTLFNDVIYNLTTGLRQNRISVAGTKTAEWNGTVNAYGFILNQDNIQEWSREVKYTKGQIVKYKNKYWTALTIVEPSLVFDELKWVVVDYENIQKGMLPNPSTRSFESTLYYNSNQTNLEQDSDLLSYSLIGYRPRDYLALVDLTDVTQINVYKNLIRNKGTRNATLAFKGANLPQGGIDYDVYENWAIKAGSYGGTLNENFVEFKVNQNNLTGNPSIVSLTDGIPTPGSNQEIPLYSLFNYGSPINTPNILNTTALTNPNPLYPNAGYVNFEDVEMASYYFSGLPAAVDASGAVVPINDFYVRDYMWLANFKEKWGVYSWKSLGRIVQVTGNLNGTATVTFAEPHNLKKLDPLAIINFAVNVDGYYIVTEILGLNDVVINLSVLNTTNSAIQGNGIGLGFVNQRVATPADIKNLDLLEAEFQKNTVWVDENSDGGWAVYRKSINYQPSSEIVLDNSNQFGSAVAYTSHMGYLIGDSGAGKVYRYTYDVTSEDYQIVETLTHDVSFGSTIVYANDIYLVSEPTSGSPAVYVYTLNNTVLSDDIVPYQTITAPVGVTDWGTKLAISDDANWIYISDLTNGKIYVYRKQNINLTAEYITQNETYVITSVGDTDFVNDFGAIDNKVGITFVANADGIIGTSGNGTVSQITYVLSTVIDGADLGLSTSDGFAKALATNDTGDLLVVGAPNKNFSSLILDNGAAYVFQRTSQNVEAQYNSIPYQPQTFRLAWTPNQIETTVVSTTAPNTVELNDTTGMSVNDPIMFTGIGLGGTGVATNLVYYIDSIVGNDITLKLSRSTTAVEVVDTAATISGITATAQTTPLYVTVNGILVDDVNYASVGNMFYYTDTLQAGDIVNISDNQFNLAQSLNNDYTDRTNIQFGYALDVNKQGSDILIGSPYEINSDGKEGAVYRFTNGGARHGVVIGTSECNVLGNRNLLINGFLVPIGPGDAEATAATINSNNITNIQASALNGKLVIQTINSNLTLPNQKLVISAFDGSTLNELGLTLFTKTQIITCPHAEGPTQFGSTIKINNAGSAIISAPAGTRFEGTTFDFTDDEQLDNDTVFDNNATRFVDRYPNAGVVYMFDFLGQYNESLLNPGAYIFAQTVDSSSLDYGYGPEYGYSLDFNENRVVVGSPNYQPVLLGGQVVVYENLSGVQDWSVYRQSAPIVDVGQIQNTQLFSAETNDTLVNLDYMDPLNGKLLGAIRSNIDYVSSVDPAKYNSDLAQVTGQVWGAKHVGEIWFNTSNVRFMNYHQNDPVYNAKYWGMLFPGSDVAVYTWVSSNVPPASYEGDGIPLDVNLFSVSSALNASGVVVPVYYFWVRNSNIITKKLGKTLSDTIIASYISNPRASGIAYMSPILPNAFALYNCAPYVNANDTVFHIGYANGTTDDVGHNEYTLIRENYPDDFLPGIPSSTIKHAGNTNVTTNLNQTSEPYGLYDRMLDSFAGCDEDGQVVPNPFLPKAVQSGILARPRQSFFFDRFLAIKNYLIYANEVLSQYPIAETRPDATFLFAAGEYYNTTDYWEYVNWWAPGYDNNTKSTVQVPVYADLSALSVPVGTLATVEQNGAGKFEVYRLDDALFGIWTRIGLENGTIRFNTNLWDYSAAKLGFGGDFFDTSSFDNYPSQETRYIIRALNEQIYIDELVEFRNKSLIILFEFIQSETTESQNFLPWLNKTSLVDVSHTIRELEPIQNLKTDNQAFLEGYLNEVKPYHVVIKDFLFKYTRTETFEGDITDFDLPATFSPTYEKFISPQLVYDVPANEYEYSITDDIWQSDSYNQWFSNYGVSLVGQNDYPMTTLVSYASLSSNYIIVDNASGFPINGVITIDDEQMSYAFVDRSLNLLGGLVRGVNGTLITDHIPGAQLYIDLPAVLLLDGGRGYTDPPKVTAYIDTTKYPAPKVPAQLEAVMGIDSVLSINVINPGQGYAVLPEIVIDPAYKVTFASTNVSNSLHTINVYAPKLQTGDLVKFKASATGESINLLDDGQWYYVGILEQSPLTVIALYTSYGNAVKDHDRIPITANANVSGMSLNAGAKASAVSSSSPIRENNITLRFDRTTYNSKLQDWKTGAYYGSFFAGNYFNSEAVSSSSINMQNTNPDISSILASAQGVPFEIVEVGNDQVLTWSSFIRYVSSTEFSTSTIKLIPQDGNNDPLNPEPNASGTTIGFYEGMPIKFVGAVVGGLENNRTYYVKSVVSDLEFTISATPGGDTIGLGDGIVNLQGLQCLVGEVTNTAVLTVNYPGILDVTETTAVTNVLRIPVSAIGTGGTIGFYPNLPVFFTGEVFGGIVENDPYYITTVIDEEHFTVSKTENPLTVAVTETIASSNTIVVDSTEGFSVNDAMIFTGTTFGNIVAGQVYFVSQIISLTEMTISTAINGPVFVLTNATGSASVVNQKDTQVLTTATGSMTMNVSLPVSPGQVNGQLFTLYNTSAQYPDIGDVNIGNLITRTITATLGDGTTDGLNRIAISTLSGSTDNFYVNMPVRVDTPIGSPDGILPSTTYYVTEFSGQEIPDPENPSDTIIRPNIEVTVLNTTSDAGEGVLTCGTADTLRPTDTLYVGMPIVFTGVALGGIVIGKEYYVADIDPDGERFKITDIAGSTPINLTTQNGIMVGTGDPYIKVSTTPGGDPVVLTNEINNITLNQYPNPSGPVFDISYILGGYRAIVSDGSSGFAINNTILITGDKVGGTTPTNDVLLTVNTIDTNNGAITDVICEGKVPDTSNQYYLKVRTPNTFGVFSDPLMTVPVSGIDFGYVGFTETTVTSVQGAPSNLITVSDASGFELNDSVVFTGNVEGSLVANQTYYIISIAGNDIQLSETPGGAAATLSSDLLTSFTMAKAGSFAFLPEPFYFTPSIVKHLGRVWVCVISNNDNEFVIGKWEELTSGDRRLNALDRVLGYYQPTINMPGVDLTQLFEGIAYPNPIYRGNAFEPDQQFPIDTVLQDQPFYPNQVNIASIAWDGSKYLSAANLPTYTAVIGSTDNEKWVIGKLTNVGVGVTDIIYAGGYYVMTSSNSATPIFRSTDGLVWSVEGYYTPEKLLPFDITPYKASELNQSSLSLNSVAYRDGYWVAVGDKILRSNDTYNWNKVADFDPTYQYQLLSVASVNTQGFDGFIAVGIGKMPDYSTGVTELVNTNIAFYSSDNGINWSSTPSVSPNGFRGVASDGSVAVTVGDEGAIYYTTNGSVWFGVTETAITSVNGATNQLIVGNTSGLAVNDTIVFNKTFASIDAGEVYYIKTIDSATQITISDTLGGPTKQLISITAGSFEVGKTYVITSVGSTNFVAIGAASNSVGTVFVATGVGTGSGIAELVSGGVIPTHTMLRLYDSFDPNPSALNDIIYVDGKWIAVGDDGTIKTSTDYLNWTKVVSGTLENLNGITFNDGTNSYTVVGDNNTIITSDDNGVTWTSVSLFEVADPVYNVRGDAFEFGYGPEELVPGLISDNLELIVTTKPGSTWSAVDYGYSGFNVRSINLTPTSANQTVYSFHSLVEYPIQLTVQVISSSTGLATTLASSQYTIDWVAKTVTLNAPIAFLPSDQLRIEAYEVGNGNQLVKSSTDVNPIRLNENSGFDEIYLNCNYSAPSFLGSGVIRPGTEPITVEATATDGVSNRITVTDVSPFVVNSSVTFQGVTFGNIQEDFTYYVKSISPATNTITVSASYNVITGIAGPTFILTTATGSMYAQIQAANGQVWTDPVVYHNGSKLVLGVSGLVTKSSSITNAFTTTSTAGMIVGEPITFCQCMFNSGILPLTTYYINNIIDGNEFTLSATPGGSTIPLQDSTGGSMFITNDYAFGIQPNGIQAKMMFSSNAYVNGEDYIVYSVFGETGPEQYGYSFPEAQEFVGNGSQSVFVLDNIVTGSNPENAIVEVGGLRLLSSQYVINPLTNTIAFNNPPVNGASIRIVTYNDTEQQYLTTQYGVTANPGSPIAELTVGQTSRSIVNYDDPETFVPVSVNAGSFVVGDSYIITSLGDTDWDVVTGSTGWTWEVGDAFIAANAGSGTGTADTQPSEYDGAGPVASITYPVSVLEIGGTYAIVSLGDTDWNDVSGSTGFDVDGNPIVWAPGDIFTVVNVGVGTGTAETVDSAYNQDLSWLTLSSGSTSVLSVNDAIIFSPAPDMLGGLIAGRTYYVTEIWDSNNFVVSEQLGGAPVVLTNDTGSMDLTSNGITVAPINSIINSLTPPLAVTNAIATNSGTNTIEVDNIANFIVGQTIQFKGTAFGGLLTNGTVYYIDTVDTINSLITLKYGNGSLVTGLTDATGNVITVVGGVPAIRVTTAIPHTLNTNDLIRIDGIIGSTQLNNNTYYVHVINPNTIDLYQQPYDAAATAVNYPVTIASTYISGGYVWRAGTFYITTTLAASSSGVTNRITTNLTSTTGELIIGTPVYFNAIGASNGDNVLGGLIQGTEYYIKEVYDENEFSVSAERYGEVFALTTDTASVAVTQWNQQNTNRVWVWVNGYRVPTDKIRVNAVNEISILTTIVPGDIVIITSMIPTATPNEEIYINFVNSTGEGSVYRENAGNRTWLTQPVYDLSTTVYVNDVTSVTDQIVQNVTTPSVSGGYYNIGLTADKNLILAVTVLNNTTGNVIDSSNYSVVVEDLSPILKIKDGVYLNAGDSLTITTLEGGTIMVNGEQINFSGVDIANNALTGIQRGANGTGAQFYIPTYTVVYGLLSENKLSDIYYNQVWNTPVYDEQGNLVEYLPLQLSDTVPALFLESDVL